MDAAEGELPPLTAFVLPGGTPKAAALHLARSAQSETAPGLVRVVSLSVHSLVEHERGRPGRSRDLAELAMRMAVALCDMCEEKPAHLRARSP